MDRLTATNRLNDGGRLLVENPQAADLDAPLTHSIIPTRSVGSVTYSRATIATVTDHEWVIRKCIAGEARFQWARRVMNLTTYSQEANSWSKLGVTVSWTKVAYTDGSLIGQTMVATATSGVHYISNSIWPVIIWNKYIFSVSVKAAWVNFVQLAFAASTTYQNFDLTNGSMTGTAGAGSIVSEWDGWYRCSVTFISTLGTNAGQGIGIVSSMSDGWVQPNLWDGVSWISVCRMQLEDVTGQSVQTAAEYVSTNVLTTAPFHWANVDWVKYFNTTLAWLPISPSILKGYLCEWQRTNILVRSDDFMTTWTFTGGSRASNVVVSPSMELSADEFIPTSGTQTSFIAQWVTVSASQYVFSVYVKPNGFNYIQLWCWNSISIWYVNFDLINGTVGTSSLWTGAIQALPNGWYRCSATTESAVLAASWSFAISAAPNASSGRNPAVTGDWVNGIYLWWAQLEVWAFASSYIPTTTVSVTRNIDALSYSVGNIIDLKWAVYCEIGVDIPWYTNLSWFIMDRWSSGRYFYANNSVTWVSSYDWTNILTSNIWSSYNGSVAKIATSWTGSTKSIYYGNTVPKTWSYDGTFWTGNINVWYSWNGTIRNVKVWKTPPTVAELTSITSQ